MFKSIIFVYLKVYKQNYLKDVAIIEDYLPVTLSA